MFYSVIYNSCRVLHSGAFVGLAAMTAAAAEGLCGGGTQAGG